mmetsp:Transcript_25655/g.46443  ORF Transcript_25655/g.46443 Transcript_25655/m.46443 type:complete len:85 (+) Transcript_25655:579-833(+)
MDISLLLEPQAKHQRMYRGNSMYSEQSLVEFDATFRARNAKSSSISKTNVKRRSVVNKKRPLSLSRPVLKIIHISSKAKRIEHN